MKRRPIGLALAGGGPFGAIYELGALIALQESVEGLDLNDLDCYVGVSAGSFLAAALANGIAACEIYRLFIEERQGAGALTPGLFPPVAIDGQHFVHGALKKTLHASEALEDGAKLVICVNPIVPFDARLAARRGAGGSGRRTWSTAGYPWSSRRPSAR